ncbi:MAG: carboxypeptidase-like regulatory domain-containing protein, partial [Gemmatimonadota bacterium]|nr:carboxypeptidase-like regulatory domain-containing protein [Gemmatimonadota bacterium]
MIQRYWLLIGCVGLISTYTRASHAQAAPSTRVVRGRVLDASRKPIGDVIVEGSDTAGHRVAGARSDSTGAFVLRGLLAGVPYVFSARRIGYARSVTAAAVIATDTLDVE